jgi:3-deoxy-D-manno-octulosonic-acid transferase
VADTIAGSDALARAMGVRRDQPLWVAGSTGPGEEPIVLDAFKRLRERHPNLQLVIVPRKPERFDEVADLIRKAGFTCIRRSERPDTTLGEPGGPPPGDVPHRETQPPRSPSAQTVFPPGDLGPAETPPPQSPAAATVFLGDTMGELRKFYCMASVVLVGRSLADMGGSDAMEVAALAKPVIVGPHNDNFADTIAQLQQGQVIRILSADVSDAQAAARQLAEAADELLSDPAAARAMGQRGRQVVLANRGATQRTIDVLMEMLSCPAPRFANS